MDTSLPAHSQAQSGVLSAADPLWRGFYRKTPKERRAALLGAGYLTPEQIGQLEASFGALGEAHADAMVENVLGVFGLPLAMVPSFPVDAQRYHVPLVVEEPSIVAGLSGAGKAFAAHGGIGTELQDNAMLGQIQLVDIADVDSVAAALRAAQAEILAEARRLQPRMVARGGGAQAVEVRTYGAAPQMLTVGIWVDTCDAMGANAVNQLCEQLAPYLTQRFGGRAVLRILSNLCLRNIVTAHISLPVASLGAALAADIVHASTLAQLDVFRATTHNKGIMNGIGALLVALGNDWRAAEAAAHAYAGMGEGYQPLATWRLDEAGAHLLGTLRMPIKVGTVGGNLQINPGVRIAQQLLGITDARQLARLAGAVGLAQNFAALRALASAGICKGHMALHARSVVTSAGIDAKQAPAAIAALLHKGEVTVAAAHAWAEQQAAAALPAPDKDTSVGDSCGKVILFGEHAVVHGYPALALPLPRGTQVRVRTVAAGEACFCLPAFAVQVPLWGKGPASPLRHSIETLLAALSLREVPLRIEAYPVYPRGSGLGGSAALAVAVLRALAAHFKLQLSLAQLCALAHEAETIAHGSASGIDHTVAAYGQGLWFVRSPQEAPQVAPLVIGQPLHLVLGLSQVPGLTHQMVSQVTAGKGRQPRAYEGIFAAMGEVASAGREALARGDAPALGELMQLNHGLLQALAVSHPLLDAMCRRAQEAGAYGAKLTGGGGGGAMVALCSDAEAATAVAEALRSGGFGAQYVPIAAQQQSTLVPQALAEVPPGRSSQLHV